LEQLLNAVPAHVLDVRTVAQDDKKVKVQYHPLLPKPSVFLGRAAEVGKITKALLEPDGKLALLYGLGGFGKSTLAAYIARLLAGQPFTAIIWSSAATIPDWGLDALLRDFIPLIPELNREPIPQQEAIALAYLRDRPTLLICDNLEDVALSEQQRLARFLTSIDGTLGSRVLLTARRDDAWLHSLVSSEGAPPFLIGGVDEVAAVTLLRTRGKHLPRLVDAADGALVEYVKAVGYNPELIKILAGLGDYERIRHVATQLPHDLEQAREELLKAAFEQLQRVPHALAPLWMVQVFTPTADYAALKFVYELSLPGYTKFDTIFSIALSSALLSVELDEAGATRYHLHPLVQRYFDETPTMQLPANVRPVIELAHLTYFMKFATEHIKQSIKANRDALMRDWENLHSAWKRAEQRRQAALRIGPADVDAAKAVMACALVVRDLVLYEGLWTEGRAILAAGVSAAQYVGDEETEALLLSNQALLTAYQDEPWQARPLYERCLLLCRKLGNPERTAGVLHQIAMVDEDLGDVESALRYYSESLAIKREINDLKGAAGTLHQLANISFRQNDLEGAEANYRESLRLKQIVGDDKGAAASLHQLALLSFARGDKRAARQLLEESLQLAKHTGEVSSIASTQLILGEFLCQEGEQSAGLAMLREALLLSERLGVPSMIASAQNAIQQYESERTH
jgi:tetratricopeptide (TPR) repeat protein